MKKGAYALIFFFWAFITIITPTLIQWSAAAAAANNTTAGKESIQSESLIIARKMMKLTPEIGLQGMRKTPPELPPLLVTSSLSPAPATKEEEDEVQVVVSLTGRLVSKSRRLFLRGV